MGFPYPLGSTDPLIGEDVSPPQGSGVCQFLLRSCQHCCGITGGLGVRKEREDKSRGISTSSLSVSPD